jgi:hypothetical protein
MPTSGNHRDLFVHAATPGRLDWFQSLLDTKELTFEEALALLSAVHVELEKPKAHPSSMYMRYAEAIEIFHQQMPEVHDQVVDAWRAKRKANLVQGIVETQEKLERSDGDDVDASAEDGRIEEPAKSDHQTIHPPESKEEIETEVKETEEEEPEEEPETEEKEESEENEEGEEREELEKEPEEEEREETEEPDEKEEKQEENEEQEEAEEEKEQEAGEESEAGEIETEKSEAEESESEAEKEPETELEDVPESSEAESDHMATEAAEAAHEAEHSEVGMEESEAPGEEEPPMEGGE